MTRSELRSVSSTAYLFVVGECEVHARKTDVRISHGVHVHFLSLKGMDIDIMQVAIVSNSNNQSDAIACEQAALQVEMRMEATKVIEVCLVPEDLQGRKENGEAAKCLPLAQN